MACQSECEIKAPIIQLHKPKGSLQLFKKLGGIGI